MAGRDLEFVEFGANGGELSLSRCAFVGEASKVGLCPPKILRVGRDERDGKEGRWGRK